MIIGIGVIIGILAGLAEITGFNFKTLFGETPLPPSGQLTVYVHGPKGNQDIVLENKGSLILDLRNDRREVQIGEHGRTNFAEIGSDFLGKQIPLSIRAKGFVMTNPDTNYVYDGQPIYLEVQREYNLGHVHGIIKDENGLGLAEVTILIENDTTTQTDSLGRFQLNLPANKIRENYKLNIQKEGYQPKSRAYYPNSNLFEVELNRVKTNNHENNSVALSFAICFSFLFHPEPSFDRPDHLPKYR